MDSLKSSASMNAPETHFRLYLYAAVVGLVRQSVQAFDSFKATVERFPFIAGYVNELVDFGLRGTELDEAPLQWRDRVLAWERAAPERLPLRELQRAAGLDYDHLVMLLGAGLVEEDMRFGPLFAALHGVAVEMRPTAGLLAAWGAAAQESHNGLAQVRRLAEIGLVAAANPEAPAAAWHVRVKDPVWLALRGASSEAIARGVRYRPPSTLRRKDELVLCESLRNAMERLPALLARGEIDTVAVRGPRGNGRRALLGAMARELGRGVLEIDQGELGSGAESSVLAPLSVLLDAMPVFVLEPDPGAVVELPALTCSAGPSGVVLGALGGFRGIKGSRQVVLDAAIPDAAARARLWRRASPDTPDDVAAGLAGRLRLPSGVIGRLAARAKAQALLAGRCAADASDVQAAGQGLEREDLDTLAVRLSAVGDWSHLVCSPQTRADLGLLEQRCRHRERLAGLVGEPLAVNLNAGVRALFKGPSGTGKTLAARLLAAALRQDLYRVDISAVVSKYIGETEKHLNRLFDRAESLDVILLFDEGDALFGRRTGVHNANDRYANLETNFLLQRIESYEGIVLITTNQSEAIDRAFERRIDATVEFRPPDADERLAIWRLHLPPRHAVPGAFLEELSYRCALSGGQIRNGVLHASLLAVDSGEPVRAGHLAAAVDREYRKTGSVCPLRPGVAAA